MLLQLRHVPNDNNSTPYCQVAMSSDMCINEKDICNKLLISLG
jgi:hypothetical protein